MRTYTTILLQYSRQYFRCGEGTGESTGDGEGTDERTNRGARAAKKTGDGDGTMDKVAGDSDRYGCFYHASSAFFEWQNSYDKQNVGLFFFNILYNTVNYCNLISMLEVLQLHRFHAASKSVMIVVALLVAKLTGLY